VELTAPYPKCIKDTNVTIRQMPTFRWDAIFSKFGHASGLIKYILYLLHLAQCMHTIVHTRYIVPGTGSIISK
jgi:hypothetical protein